MKNCFTFTALTWLTVGWLTGGWPTGGVALGADEPVDYLRQIKPILQARCYACHGVLKQAADLRLDTAGLAIQGGESGAAIAPGNLAESLLLQRVGAAEESERMPPEGEPLSAAQISLLKTWIAQGAKAPATETPERDPRDHWAFKPPVRPAVPQVADADWNRNPIDAFIAAEHQRHALRRQPPADKHVWLRRIYLDLVGLPPTRAELDAFLADESPRAYEAVAARLLDSPQHGERWGRHWMDVWRYSDWWGLGPEVRSSQKHIWHWRDWIVESLNADKGYDQMLREMLAADELYPDDLDRLRASGFLARHYFRFNRTTWLDETIEHTSKAMLGLTFNCAKCHDHKYDPLSQVDYYRLRAVFEPYQVRTDLVPGESDVERDGIPRAFDCNLDVPTYLHVRGDDRNPDKARVLEPSVPTILTSAAWKVEPVLLPLLAYQPDLRPFVAETYRQTAEQELVQARTALDKAREQQTQSAAAGLAVASGSSEAKPASKSTNEMPSIEQAQLVVAAAAKRLVAAEAQSAAIGARVEATEASRRQPPADDAAVLAHATVKLERIVKVAKAEEAVAQAELALARAAAEKKADANKKLALAHESLVKASQAVEPSAVNFTPLSGALKTVESNLETDASRRKPFPPTSTGRRSAFAKWLTDRRNPLAARVAVNHMWLRHFGRPLVPNVFDFGRKGAPPTHPELLDWLAVELMENGWSMKHLHRLMATSLTYRMTSSGAGAAADNLASDHENKYYWRANPVRMESQVVRDSLLHLAGELDLARGGPSIPVNDETSRRRSLYFVHSHNERQKFLEMFDDANVLDCYRRADSIVPQQALALENSQLVTAMGAKIAERIAADCPGASDREFIRAAFLTVLLVEPSDTELALAADGLTRLTEAARKNHREPPAAQARLGLIHALLNHNDFVTIR